MLFTTLVFAKWMKVNTILMEPLPVENLFIDYLIDGLTYYVKFTALV